MQIMKSKDMITFEIVKARWKAVTIVVSGNALGRDFKKKPIKLYEGDSYEVIIDFEVRDEG